MDEEIEHEERMESYREIHGNDHDDEIREAKEAMDMRDHFDQYGYNQ